MSDNLNPDQFGRSTSPGVARHDEEHPIAGVCPDCGGVTQGEGDALHCLDCYWQPEG